MGATTSKRHQGAGFVDSGESAEIRVNAGADVLVLGFAAQN
jgi:hypothetical protein